MSEQVMILFAGTHGYTSHVPVERIKEYETQVLRYLGTQYAELGQAIMRDGQISDETEERLREALDLFNKSWE